MDRMSNISNTSPPADSTGIVIHVYGKTDVGMVREHNEDNLLIANLATDTHCALQTQHAIELTPKGALLLVCDGMGGAAAGEVASQIGVDTIHELMRQAPVPESERDLARTLNEAISEAGKRIFVASRLNREQRGMGTTATAAVLFGARIIFGQIGDSRAHIIRNDALFQTTKDQSLVQQLIDAKQLSPEEARHFDRSNIILQALGTTEEVHVDLSSTVLRRGDVLVMCSDGLSGLVMPEEILEVVRTTPDIEQIAEILTRMACDNGGDDNISVIVARFEGDALLAPSPDENPGYERFFLHEPTETTAVGAYPKKPKRAQVANTAAVPAAAAEALSSAPVVSPAQAANATVHRAATSQSVPWRFYLFLAVVILFFLSLGFVVAIYQNEILAFFRGDDDSDFTVPGLPINVPVPTSTDGDANAIAPPTGLQAPMPPLPVHGGAVRDSDAQGLEANVPDTNAERSLRHQWRYREGQRTPDTGADAGQAPEREGSSPRAEDKPLGADELPENKHVGDNDHADDKGNTEKNNEEPARAGGD